LRTGGSGSARERRQRRWRRGKKIGQCRKYGTSRQLSSSKKRVWGSRWTGVVRSWQKQRHYNHKRKKNEGYKHDEEDYSKKATKTTTKRCCCVAWSGYARGAYLAEPPPQLLLPLL
jgi:hypothetical protein